MCIFRSILKALILFTCLTLVSCGKKTEDSDSKDRVITTSSTNTETPNKLKDELKNAIDSNDTYILNEALKKHKHLHFRFDNGETPLTHAIKYSQPKMIVKILVLTEDINIPNTNGLTPLMLSIQSKKYDTVFSLLNRKNIAVNLVTKKKNTALHYALSSGLIYTIASRLIIKGANFEFKNDNGESPEDLMSRNGNTQLLEFIEKIKNYKEESITFDSVLDEVTAQNTEFIEYLVNNSAKVLSLIRERNILTPTLNMQNEARSNFLLKLFLSKGADVDGAQRQSSFDPPLAVATKLGRRSSVRILLAYKPDINIPDSEGKTAIIYAVEELEFELVKTLLEKKASKEYEVELNGDLKTVEVCDYLPPRSYRHTSTQKRNRINISRLLECSYF